MSIVEVQQQQENNGNNTCVLPQLRGFFYLIFELLEKFSWELI
jgi:hypothetical protein